MKKMNHQPGFHIVELVLFIVVLGLIGLLGYTFYSNSQIAKDDTLNIMQSPVATDVQSAPEIIESSDLVDAEKVIDSADLDGSSDNAQLNSQLSSF